MADKDDGDEGETLDLDAIVDDGAGGQATVRELIDAGKNRKSWETSLKQKDMEVAAERRQVGELLDKVVDNAGTKSAPTEDEGGDDVDEFDIAKELAALPDQVEDKEGYDRGLADVMRRQGEFIEKRATERAAQKDQEAKNDQQREQAERDADAAAKDNETRCRAWAEKNHPDLTPNQIDDLVTAVGSLRGEKYGELQNFNGIRVLSYNEEAYEAGMKLADSIATKMDAKTRNEIRREMERDGERGRNATNEGNLRLPDNAPPANSSVKEKVDWIRNNLDEDQAARYITGLDADERDRLMTYAYDNGSGELT